MEQPDIHNYLERFFCNNDCDILENDGKFLRIQLTEEMDKQLMNRPFYWKYIKSTNMTPQPMTLKFVTAQSDEKQEGERIHFGSPRLHQIFRETQQHASHIRLFEYHGNEKKTLIQLEPWIGLNVKISYQCDHKKDRLISLGLHLINGQIVDHFHEHVMTLDMRAKIPDYCYTLTPMIKPQSGLKRLETLIEDSLHQEDHTWAEEARKRWTEDLTLLDQFYENQQEKPESYQLEKSALKEQYEPNIHVQIVNGGLFYLTKKAFTDS